MNIYNRREGHFKHCVVSEEEYMNRIYQNEDFDFLSMSSKSYYEFLHVTPKNNTEKILEKGLLLDFSNKEAHLGEGIYGVNISFDVPKDILNYYIYNFILYLDNAFCDNPNLELTLFVGSKSAVTEFCIDGEDNHSGFLVFKENIEPEYLVHHVSLNKENYKQLLDMDSIISYQEIFNDNTDERILEESDGYFLEEIDGYLSEKN